MKVLFFDSTPAYFCPGGKQVQAQKLYENLTKIGVQVEYARWWDPEQKCEILHLFDPSVDMVKKARKAGVKNIILIHLVDWLSSKSLFKQSLYKIKVKLIRFLLPSKMLEKFFWSIFSEIDAFVYQNETDANTASFVFGIPENKVYVINHGYEKERLSHFSGGQYNEKSYLISVANISSRKNNLLLAKAARKAKVPIVFIGKALEKEGAYFQEFRKCVDDNFVRYLGFVSEEEKYNLLKGASGFILLSTAESGCIAVYEASMAGLPLLLSNLPWAHSYGNSENIDFVNLDKFETIVSRLQIFYENSRRLENFTFPMCTWEEVAKKYLLIYNRLLDDVKSGQGKINFAHLKGTNK
jgi:glycosyltransferase involved in cell wall biosynthesis